MKGIILYQSKYGATKKYAQWLAEATGFDVAETKKADIRQVAQYDTVILGGGVYASGIAGLSFLRRHMDKLAGKKVIAFCVGASPYDEAAVQQIVQHNMKGVLAGVPLFYCRGAWDEEAMGLVDRMLCRMLQKAVAKQDASTLEPWMAALLSAVGQKCDWTDRKHLAPILAELGMQVSQPE